MRIHCPALLLGLFTLALPGVTAAGEPAGDPQCAPAIGVWYTVWWTKEDQYHHWINCHRVPVRGEYYRDESQPEVFLFDGQRFVHQGAMPRRAAVILTPAGVLDRMRRSCEVPPASPPSGHGSENARRRPP